VAIAWLHNHSISKVYLESYRSGVRAPAEVISSARTQLEAAGIAVEVSDNSACAFHRCVAHCMHLRQSCKACKVRAV
jgi:hypothetical protein